MSSHALRAAFAATAVVLSAALCRADDQVDAFQLVRESFAQQTGEELSADLARNLFRAWQSFERRGLTKTTDRPPCGALVFYHTPYGAGGRFAVSNGDGTVLLKGEPIGLDTVPGRLGWIEGPKKTTLEVAPTRSATTTTCGTGTGTTGTGTTGTGTTGDGTTGTTTAADPTKKPDATTTATSDGLPAGPAKPGAAKPVASNPNPNPGPLATNTGNPGGNPGFSNPGTQSGGSNPGSSSPAFSNPGSSSPAFSNPGSSNPGSQSPSFSNPGSQNTGSSAPASSNTGNAANPYQQPLDPNFRPTAGSSFTAKGTGYYPANTKMEGGFFDRKGKRLQTLQDFLAGRSPFVSVAMDATAFPYGTKLRIKEFEAKYGREIEFRVVDTGGAFKNKGTTRIDICTANDAASKDATVNGMLHCEVVR